MLFDKKMLVITFFYEGVSYMKIKVVANLRDKKATAMSQDIATLEKDCKEISSILGTLNEKYWQGADATAFIKKYNDQILPEIKKYIKSFKQFQDYQSKVPGIFTEVDNSYKSKIEF